MGTNVTVSSGNAVTIFTSTSAPTTSNWTFKQSPLSSFQATVVGTGAVTATVTIEASNDGLYPLSTLLGTITLSGTTFSSDGFTTNAPWKFIRANVTSISGTNATVSVIMGV